TSSRPESSSPPRRSYQPERIANGSALRWATGRAKALASASRCRRDGGGIWFCVSARTQGGTEMSDEACCLDLQPDATCDVLDFRSPLTHTPLVREGDRQRVVPVEVVITARLERCPGPMVQGDLVYTTTLLPGEKVRLFPTDRKTQFVHTAETTTL